MRTLEIIKICMCQMTKKMFLILSYTDFQSAKMGGGDWASLGSTGPLLDTAVHHLYPLLPWSAGLKSQRPRSVGAGGLDLRPASVPLCWALSHSVTSDSATPGLQPARLPCARTFQARMLEWVVSFSRGSSRPREWTHISCIPQSF